MRMISPEWHANRAVLERQAFYVRWARRRCKEGASTVIARVTGGSGRGSVQGGSRGPKARVPIDARASLIVLAAQLQALQR